MSKVGSCNRLESLILTGCTNVGDEGINKLVLSDRPKAEGFPEMKVLKLGGLKDVSEGSLLKLIQICPSVTFLEINNMERLTDYALSQII